MLRKSFKYFREYDQKKIPFYKVSIINKKDLEKIFKRHKFYALIHFAEKKSVSESVEKPLFYYENNFIGTFNIIELCLKYKVNNFIFSSSCTIYGNRDDKPKEDEKMLFPINPYGRSKLFIEYMLKDIAKVEKDFIIALLRYCNPVATRPSGKIGEDPLLKRIISQGHIIVLNVFEKENKNLFNENTVIYNIGTIKVIC